MTLITQKLSTILDPTLLGAMFHAQLILIVQCMCVNFLINKYYKQFTILCLIILQLSLEVALGRMYNLV